MINDIQSTSQLSESTKSRPTLNNKSSIEPKTAKIAFESKNFTSTKTKTPTINRNTDKNTNSITSEQTVTNESHIHFKTVSDITSKLLLLKPNSLKIVDFPKCYSLPQQKSQLNLYDKRKMENNLKLKVKLKSLDEKKLDKLLEDNFLLPSDPRVTKTFSNKTEILKSSSNSRNLPIESASNSKIIVNNKNREPLLEDSPHQLSQSSIKFETLAHQTVVNSKKHQLDKKLRPASSKKTDKYNVTNKKSKRSNNSKYSEFSDLSISEKQKQSNHLHHNTTIETQVCNTICS
ncbi:uncharacterized protein LOC126899109 [Daktulosphaira vitifoliae]|uniref:uncharacterized protein LOC126899109 n=1 Tax=Daktulosphaira vitifoliae TaxID=58002 RepID=UPI0021AAC772|nr:uncharacterized protein LOC126899109 [Daktulosphaira vitifoliae]